MTEFDFFGDPIDPKKTADLQLKSAINYPNVAQAQQALKAGAEITPQVVADSLNRVFNNLPSDPSVQVFNALADSPAMSEKLLESAASKASLKGLSEIVDIALERLSGGASHEFSENESLLYSAVYSFQDKQSGILNRLPAWEMVAWLIDRGVPVDPVCVKPTQSPLALAFSTLSSAKPEKKEEAARVIETLVTAKAPLFVGPIHPVRISASTGKALPPYEPGVVFKVLSGSYDLSRPHWLGLVLNSEPAMAVVDTCQAKLPPSAWAMFREAKLQATLPSSVLKSPRPRV